MENNIIKVLYQIKQSERSCLVYLLDALENVPNQCKDLTNIIREQNISDALKAILNLLDNISDTLNRVKQLRELMR